MSCIGKFPDMPCMKKGFTKTQRRRSTGLQPGTKSAFRPADKPLINRLSTGRCVPPSVYIGFRLFVLLEKRSGDVSSMHWRLRGTLVSWANCSVGVPSCPAPPRRHAVRPDPTRPWYVRVLDSTSLAETKRCCSIGQQPGTGCSCRPVDETGINRCSNVDFFPHRFTWDFMCLCF